LILPRWLGRWNQFTPGCSLEGQEGSVSGGGVVRPIGGEYGSHVRRCSRCSVAGRESVAFLVCVKRMLSWRYRPEGYSELCFRPGVCVQGPICLIRHDQGFFLWPVFVRDRQDSRKFRCEVASLSLALSCPSLNLVSVAHFGL